MAFWGRNMENDYSTVMMRVNCLASDLDNLYHQAAQKLGISDSVLFLLYVVCENSGRCPLADIRTATGMTKQTLNSALRRLENDGVVTLAQHSGRSKIVCLTETGVEYAEKTVMRLFNAESSVFKSWLPDEISTYLKLMERYNNDFRAQIERM
jgi:DNA-binding MarR family transcriptional regulator